MVNMVQCVVNIGLDSLQARTSANIYSGLKALKWLEEKET